jgi:hypothetical protein
MVFTTLPMRRNSPLSGRSWLFQLDGLAEVPAGHRRDRPRELRRRVHDVGDQFVDRLYVVRPGPHGPRQLGALFDPALPADRLAQPGEFARLALGQVDHFVERVGDVAVDAVHALRQAGAEIAVAEGAKGGQELTLVQLGSDSRHGDGLGARPGGAGLLRGGGGGRHGWPPMRACADVRCVGGRTSTNIPT